MWKVKTKCQNLQREQKKKREKKKKKKKKKNDLTINKSDRFADISIQAVLPAKLQCQYLRLR